jgi:hypothetical protein
MCTPFTHACADPATHESGSKPLLGLRQLTALTAVPVLADTRADAVDREPVVCDLPVSA